MEKDLITIIIFYKMIFEAMNKFSVNIANRDKSFK